MPEVPKKGFMGCNDAYKALYGSCDAYPVEKTVQAIASVSSSSVVTSSTSPVKAGFLDDAFVTGSVMSGKGQHYTFKVAGRPFDAYSAGYEVESVDWCTAILQRDSIRQIVHCNPYFDSDTPDSPVTIAKQSEPVTVTASLPDSLTSALTN
ncbi:hypothetical protein V8687_12055 [Shewanella baltica]|uniref:hypothetical protein n=1 Tax=Shewanella baltica TaxID=62322 RepID=UPI0030D15622